MRSANRGCLVGEREQLVADIRAAIGVPVRMRSTTIPATPAAMGRFLRQLGDDIERADGDLVLIGVGVYPVDGDPLDGWNVQVTIDVDDAVLEPEEPAQPEKCPTCGGRDRELPGTMPGYDDQGCPTDCTHPWHSRGGQ